MIEKAINDFKIIRNDSFVIGDKEIDISSAKKVKSKAFCLMRKIYLSFIRIKLKNF